MISPHSPEVALAAVYTPGFERGHPMRWPALLDALRREKDIRKAGFAAEADALADVAQVEWAEELLRIGRVGTWLGDAMRPLPPRIEIGASARRIPPVVWRSYSDSASKQCEGLSNTVVAGIGSREASANALGFARDVGRGLLQRGHPLVSGGAAGSDAAFGAGHGAAVAVLPHGIDLPRRDLEGHALRLSGFAPQAAFSLDRVMRRNRLITSLARVVFVASVRWGVGGSWNAASEALRRETPRREALHTGTAVAVYIGRGCGVGAEELARQGALPVRDADEALALAELVSRTGPGEELQGEELHAAWARESGHPDPRLQRELRFT